MILSSRTVWIEPELLPENAAFIAWRGLTNPTALLHDGHIGIISAGKSPDGYHPQQERPSPFRLNHKQAAGINGRSKIDLPVEALLEKNKLPREEIEQILKG